MKTTQQIPTTILTILRRHLGPMTAAAAERSPCCASWNNGGMAILVAREGRAYSQFTAEHPHLSGSPLVVVDWYGQEGHSSDGLSMGPAVSLLPPSESPTYQLLMTMDEAQALVANP